MVKGKLANKSVTICISRNQAYFPHIPLFSALDPVPTPKMRPSSSTILLTSTLLLPSHAQNTTNTPQNTTTCSPNYHPNLSTSPVNSTGTLKWTWDILFSSNSYTLPWFYSVLLNATTPRNAGPPITVSTYISVPDNLPNGTRICAYQFGSINATLEDPQSGTHSCKGAISDSCIEFLNEGWKKAGVRSGNRCPDYYDGTAEGRKAFEERCPELGMGSARCMYLFSLSHSHFRFLTFLPSHVYTQTNHTSHTGSHYQSPTNTSCPTTHLPNIDLPDGYISLNAPSQLTPFEDFTFEESVSLEQMYDLMTRQVVPLVVRAELEGESGVSQGSTEYLCVVANETVEGSRRVEGGVPWSGVGRVKGRRWAVGVGVVVGMLLVW